WATNTNQAAPDSSVSGKAIQAIHAKRRPTVARNSALAGGRRAGCAMKTSNNAAPAAVSVAAKWTARTKISGSSTPYARGPPRKLRSLADTKGEASFRLVRVDREHVPTHLVGSGRQRLQADRHGAAADLRLAGINTCALAVGHLHRAERGFQTLREGKRDLARRRADRSADRRARTGEHGVRGRAAS